MRKKLFRITTVPITMNKILPGQLRFINNYYNVIGVSKFVEKDFKEIKQRENINLYSVPFERTINLSKDLLCLIKLILLFIKEKPFIVHTHTPKAGLLGMLAAKITNVPVRIHTVGGMPLMEVKGLKRKILILLERITYKCALVVMPNSNGLKDFILKESLTKKDKIKVIGNGSSNGIDTDFYSQIFFDSERKSIELKMKLNIKQNDFTFLYIGRLANDKGITELVNAFLKLTNKKSNVKLLLVGPLEMENSLLSKEVYEIITQHTQIIYPGRTDDVRLFLKIADCFVFPSYREGFPNALLQAASMGLPIIATDINGCNEIIEHNQSGLLVEVKNVDALYKSMLNIMEDKELRSFFSVKIRENTVEKFNQKHYWNLMLQQYDSFLSTNK